MTRAQTAERTNAIDKLRELLPPGTRVYTILRHVSRSGMQRHISAVVHAEDGNNDITWLVARACGYTIADDGGIKCAGAGMDVGFHLIHNLSYALYPDGFVCTGVEDPPRLRCPSNDHSNSDRDYSPHHHRSGGYALRQQWL